jgi:hypothetical protein
LVLIESNAATVEASPPVAAHNSKNTPYGATGESKRN